MIDLVSRAEENKLLTLEDIYDPGRKGIFEGKSTSLRKWVSDDHYMELINHEDKNDEENSLWRRIDARTGEGVALYDLAVMRTAIEESAGVSALDATEMSRPSKHRLNSDQTAALIEHNGTLAYYRFGSDRITLCDTDIDMEAGAGFSPNGSWISYIKNDNIYVTKVPGETTHALTTRGGGSVLAGRLDWVYQEELYGRGNFTGHWWSPDATHIAFLELDTSQVREHWIPDHVSNQQDQKIHYPRAGESNPTVRLGVVSVPEGHTRWIDTSKYDSIDHLIVRVAWAADGASILFQVQDREQQWLDLVGAEPKTGQARTIFRETTPAWVESLDNPHWLEDGSFVWLSERSGWRHIYHYNEIQDAPKPVTSGDWDVRKIYGIDTVQHWIYFSATEHSPIAAHTYRIRPDGSGLERLTDREGTHASTFSPTFRYFIDSWSNAVTPPEVRLHRVLHQGDDETIDEGEILNTHSVPNLSIYAWGRTELTNVSARDGFKLPGMLIRPPDFDPNRKYPVLCHVYGGPMTPKVQDAWGGSIHAWHHMLAQRGAIVWVLDNRSSSGRGAVASWPIYRRVGEMELSDLEDGITWLKSQRYVDPERLGIWGWSFGGYLTAYAMTHSALFRMGIAGAPVTDWNLYDSIYTERYMSRPSNNPEGYRNSSVLEGADKLHGKLLILHGTMDENVHIEHSMQLVHKLQKADKDFETMFYPQAKHKIEDPEQLYHMQGVMTNFVLENL